MNEEEQRDLVIKTAKEYIGTPYHPEGRRKGVGVDCLTLLSGVWEDAGLLPRVEIPHYSPEFMLHKSEERYLDGLLQYCREIPGPPLPGDIALWKFGRCYSHAAIVVKWPVVIHAYMNSKVGYEDLDRAIWLSRLGGGPRPVKFFSFWGR